MIVGCVAIGLLTLERSVTVGSSLGPVLTIHAVWLTPANCRMELFAGEHSSPILMVCNMYIHSYLH